MCGSTILCHPQIPGQKGSPYYTDVVTPSYISVHKSGDNRSISTVVMVIEIKKVVFMLVRRISGKDIMELLVYMYYVMKDKRLNQLCGGHYRCKSVACIVNVNKSKPSEAEH